MYIFHIKASMEIEINISMKKNYDDQGSEEIFQMNRMNIAFIEFYKQTS